MTGGVTVLSWLDFGGVTPHFGVAPPILGGEITQKQTLTRRPPPRWGEAAQIPLGGGRRGTVGPQKAPTPPHGGKPPPTGGWGANPSPPKLQPGGAWPKPALPGTSHEAKEGLTPPPPPPNFYAAFAHFSPKTPAFFWGGGTEPQFRRGGGCADPKTTGKGGGGCPLCHPPPKGKMLPLGTVLPPTAYTELNLGGERNKKLIILLRIFRVWFFLISLLLTKILQIWVFGQSKGGGKK